MVGERGGDRRAIGERGGDRVGAVVSVERCRKERGVGMKRVIAMGDVRNIVY